MSKSTSDVPAAKGLLTEVVTQLRGFLSDSEHVRAIQRLYELQRADGGWGLTGSQDRACFTAQAIEGIARVAIDSANLPLIAQFVEDKRAGKSPAEQQIVRGLNWLLNRQGEDGRWGDDAWDTSLVIRVLLDLGFERAHPAITKATAWICHEVETSFASSKFWAGPAQAAAAMQVFLTLDREDRPFQSCREMLLKPEGIFGARPNGCFGAGTQAGWEWHTAAVIVALANYRSFSAGEAVESSVSLLREGQSSQGYWGDVPIREFVTSLAARAMETRRMGAPEAEAALGWYRAELERRETDNYPMMFMSAYTHATVVGTPPLTIASSTIQVLIDHYLEPLSQHLDAIDADLVQSRQASHQADELTKALGALENEVSDLRLQNRHLRWNRSVQVAVGFAAFAALVIALLSIIGRAPS